MKFRFSSRSSKGYGPERTIRNHAFTIIFAVAAFVGAAPAQAEPVEVLAFGDSLTQGYGLEPGQGLVPQLQSWLRAQGADVNVTNAGVSGDTTAGGRSRLGWSLTPDIDVVILELGGNDLLRGLPPAQSRANLDAMLAELKTRELPVLLVGLAAPGNYGAAYKAQFDAIWPELAQKYDVPLLPDLLAPIAAFTPEERAARYLMQGDNIHPAPDGVKLVVEQLGPKVLDLIQRN